VKKLFNDFYNQDIKTYDDITKTYKGIEYVDYYNHNYEDEDEYILSDEIEKVENHFKININVYTNDKCNKEINEKTGEKERNYIVEIDRRSMLKYDDTLNLMRYKNHFMFIKDLNQIRHCYRCKKCSKIFNNMEACNRHEKTCDELIKHTFVGGVYEESKSIFKKIIQKNSKFCFKNEMLLGNEYSKLSKFKDIYYPYFCAYDFEAMVKPLHLNDNDNKLKITCEHVPVSVSIFSNVPGYDIEPIFICNDNPEFLINEFTNQLYIISQKAKELLEPKYKQFFNCLQMLQRAAEVKHEAICKYADPYSELVKYSMLAIKGVESLQRQLQSWIETLPIIGFNSSKYDINLMKQYLFKSFNNINQTVSFSIKKANSYMSIKTDNLQFLDIRSYLAPNYSYDAFIKAYKCRLFSV
jgi:hypothetical protein